MIERVNGVSKVGKGWIKYKNIAEGQFSGEMIITFKTLKGELTAIFPSSYIDKTQQSFSAIVIGVEEDRYLVDLPTYTFTTGSRAWFPKEAVSFAMG